MEKALLMSNDKRNYFRVSRDILLDYRAIDAFTAKETEPEACFARSPSLQLLANFRQLDKEATPLLMSVAEKNRELAEYLKLTSRKFELLAQHIISNDNTAEQQASIPVNLSEGGIAFGTDKPLYKGSFLALQATFVPTYTNVCVFAQVIRCDMGAAGEHMVAAKFLHRSEAKRELISREIMRIQLKLARAKKTSTNTQSN